MVGSILLIALGYYFGRLYPNNLNAAAVKYETRFIDSIIYHHEYMAASEGTPQDDANKHGDDDYANSQVSSNYQPGLYQPTLAFWPNSGQYAAPNPFSAAYGGIAQSMSSSGYAPHTSNTTPSGDGTNAKLSEHSGQNQPTNASPQWRERLNMKLSEPAPPLINTTMAKAAETNADSQLPKLYEKSNKEELVANAGKQKAKTKKKFPFEPKDIADIYTSRNFKLMGGFGTTYLPGGSLGYYGELGLSKRIFKRFYLGIHFNQMNVRGTDIASFQSNRMTHYERHYTNNATLKSSSWAQETLTVSEVDLRQTGLMFQYEISPKLSINASYLVMTVRHFNFLMNSTHIDSSHVYLNGEEIEARRDKVYTEESGGERSGSSLQEYNMRQVGSLELGFDYQLTKHLSWNATFGTSIDNPFPVPLYWYGSEVTQGFGWLKRPEDIRYIKTGIRIHL